MDFGTGLGIWSLTYLQDKKGLMKKVTSNKGIIIIVIIIKKRLAMQGLGESD